MIIWEKLKLWCHPPKNIVTITSRQRFSQLLLLPLLPTSNKVMSNSRNNKGFGSSDVYWSEVISAQNHFMTL